MRFHKILCPIDFSEGSKAALRAAIRIANDVGAELVVAHVCYLGASVALAPVMIGELEKEAARFLAEATVEATSLGAKRVSSRLLTGVPWSAVVDLLERDRAIDLVVVGTHGRTGIARFLIGSVAEKILRHAPCSVLVVRLGKEPTTFAHVMCPIDFSIDAEQATELAAQLVQPTGKITLFHATEIPFTYFGGGAMADVVHVLEAASAQLADKAVVLLRAKVSIPVTAKTAKGRFPGATLLDAIEEDPSIDLVVMGSHGRTGIRRAMLGSVAEKIARHAPCPVLVTRRRPVDLN